MGKEEIDIEQLKTRGLTCARLKSMESKERRDKESAFKDARNYRSYGFNQGAELQEKVGIAQEELANKIRLLSKKVCGLK